MKKLSILIKNVMLNLFQHLIPEDKRFRNKFGMTDKKGFTLIEMVVVIGVLAALAGLLLAVVDPMAQFQKANDGRRKSDLSQIQKVLEQYYQDNGVYPTHSTEVGNLYRLKSMDGEVKEWGDPWTPYMNILPEDPDGSKNYVYYSGSNGQAYYLYASLDRAGKDVQACTGEDNVCSSLSTNSISSTACGGTCNYGISSPNVSP